MYDNMSLTSFHTVLTGFLSAKLLRPNFFLNHVNDTAGHLLMHFSNLHSRLSLLLWKKLTVQYIVEF